MDVRTKRIRRKNDEKRRTLCHRLSGKYGYTDGCVRYMWISWVLAVLFASKSEKLLDRESPGFVAGVMAGGLATRGVPHELGVHEKVEEA